MLEEISYPIAIERGREDTSDEIQYQAFSKHFSTAGKW